MDSLRFSIITPCLNSEHTIRRAIDSVRNQSTLPFDYWVIDGGSTDATVSILNEHSDVITGYISERDCGISDAFNKGIMRSQGDFIIILNSDDWLEPEALSDIESSLAQLSPHERGNTIAHCDIRVHSKNGKAYRLRPRLTSNTTSHWSFYFDMPINHPGSCISKSLYERAGNYDTAFKIAMDYELILRTRKHSPAYVYINKTLANFSSEGISGTNTYAALLESRRAQIKNRLPRLICESVFIAKLFVNRAKHMLTRSLFMFDSLKRSFR